MTDAAQDKHVAALRAFNAALGPEEIVQRAERFHVGVWGKAGRTHDTDVVLSVLANLLPRVFRKVSFSDRPAIVAQLPPSHKALVGDLLAPQSVDFLIVVDDEAPGPTPPRSLHVASRGWVAYLSRSKRCSFEDGPPNGVAAVYAAALAVGEAFNDAYAEVLPGRRLEDTLVYDVLRLQRVTAPCFEPRVDFGVHIPEMLVVGLGAVGQALVEALASLPDVSGNIRLVDHDRIDESNRQRCLFAFAETVGAPKVLLAARNLRKRHPLVLVDTPAVLEVAAPAPPNTFIDGKPVTQLSLTRLGDYRFYRSVHRGRKAEPLVVTCLDSEQARRDVQAGLPKTILNGWTETGQGQLAYGIGRHTIGVYGCLTCFHLPVEGRPDESELAASRTGWSREECRRRLDNPSEVLSVEEARLVERFLSVPSGAFEGFIGKPLAEFLHGQCGLATFPRPESGIVASVTHVPTLVGALLAAQVVVETLGVQKETGLAHLAFFDARRLPTSYQRDERRASPRCICNLPIVRDAYQRQWAS